MGPHEGTGWFDCVIRIVSKQHTDTGRGDGVSTGVQCSAVYGIATLT